MIMRSLHVAAILWFASTPLTLRAQSSECRPADATSARMVVWLKNVVTGTDPASIAQRTQMGLPQVSASQVTLVTNKTVCSKVLSAYKGYAQNEDATTHALIPSSGQLYVFQVGSVYTATDPAHNVGEYSIWVSMDSRYRVLTSSMG